MSAARDRTTAGGTERGMELMGMLFRTAADTLGGWWSSEAPRQAASGWSDRAEENCRSHFHASATGATQPTRATQATNAARKSPHGAMQSAGEMSTSFSAGAGAGATSPESASDGFAAARPGYQLGYVARRNPDYRDRSFAEVEPELRRVWESGARAARDGSASGSSGDGSAGNGPASGSSWPEVRGFVDFAYQQGGDR